MCDKTHIFIISWGCQIDFHACLSNTYTHGESVETESEGSFMVIANSISSHDLNWTFSLYWICQQASEWEREDLNELLIIFLFWFPQFRIEWKFPNINLSKIESFSIIFPFSPLYCRLLDKFCRPFFFAP